MQHSFIKLISLEAKINDEVIYVVLGGTIDRITKRRRFSKIPKTFK